MEIYVLLYFLLVFECIGLYNIDCLVLDEMLCVREIKVYVWWVMF